MRELPAQHRTPAPTSSGIALRSADFATLAEALDYAARGDTGFDFHDGKGALSSVLPYRELRARALALAPRLAALGRGERVALVADTHPDFAVMFYACQYAGLVPVPLPAAVHLGGRDAFVRHLRALLEDCAARAAFAPPEFASFLSEAAAGLSLAACGTLAAFEMLEAVAEPVPSAAGELAYLQYTSGSTRFPRGTMITQSAVMANLRGIFDHGIGLAADDRFCSWLPYYHDMGLVGFVLGSVATQRSVDFLPTRAFAMRPRLWLQLISRNRCTVSFGPPFGYTLCARRLRPADAESLDLSSWRIAGVGAEMIHPEALQRFADVLAPARFDARAFTPCYGMAECSLAVSFSERGAGARSDTVDIEAMSRTGEAKPVDGATAGAQAKTFIDCGRPLPDFEVEIRDAAGRALAERRCGRIHLRGPSVMRGYFGQAEATRGVLGADGWLDTGDLGYSADGSLYVTGRAKDLMIVKGRNVWPQDLEHLAEQQPDVRLGDTSAFSVPQDDGGEIAVLVVQARDVDAQRLAALAARLREAIHAEFGVECLVELVPPHTLPRTSSGKLSRSTARQQFLARREDDPLGVAPAVFIGIGERSPAPAAASPSRDAAVASA